MQYHNYLYSFCCAKYKIPLKLWNRQAGVCIDLRKPALCCQVEGRADSPIIVDVRVNA